MKKLTSYLFLGTGTLGFFFFLIYDAPEREMWFVLSLVIAGIGGFWVLMNRFNKAMADNAARFSHSYDLRYKGGKVRVTLDNCEVKSRCYFQDITNDDWFNRTRTFDDLYDNNRNYKTREVLQTYIVYNKIINGVAYTFVSDGRSISREAMRQFLQLQRGIDLYIDKNNPAIYMFDLPNL